MDSDYPFGIFKLFLHIHTHIKVKERFHYCSAFDGHRRVFNNEDNSYPKMSLKAILFKMNS